MSAVARVLATPPGSDPGKAAVDACLTDPRGPESGCLAIVIDHEGHTYARPGTMVYLPAAGGHVGWISAGCHEARLQQAAADALREGRAQWLDLDNRDLLDVFGSGSGCRGRQRVLVLPLAALSGSAAVLAAWRTGAHGLQVTGAADGRLRMRCGEHDHRWTMPGVAAAGDWTLQMTALPRLLCLGAGPESAVLLALLDALGWRVEVVEARARWQAAATPAERVQACLPELPDAAVLLMSHHFETDRAALQWLADAPALPPWIGVLGPRRRCEDLLATLPARVGERLWPHLEAPAGQPVMGRGAAAIALALATRLQALRGDGRFATGA